MIDITNTLGGLKELVISNEPPKGHITVGNLKVAARRAGLSFNSDGAVTDGYGTFGPVTRGFDVYWKATLDVEEGVVRYTPQLKYSSLSSLERRILEGAGYIEKTVTIGVPIKRLPVPAWVSTWLHDYDGNATCGIVSFWLFASEAAEMKNAFIAELG